MTLVTMDFTTLLVTFASFIAVVSFLPQTIRCFRTKHTKDISLTSFTILCVSAASWALYGLLRSDVPIIVTNGMVFLMAFAIVFMKLRYG